MDSCDSKHDLPLRKNEVIPSVSNKNQPITHLVDEQPRVNKMVKEQLGRKSNLSTREIEKEKLINELSKPPKTQLNSKAKKSITASKIKNTNFTPDSREKEKDRLAEIFASSSYQYTKPSNHQISKNLISEIGVKDNEKLDREKPLNVKESNISNKDIPKICITEHQEYTKNLSNKEEPKEEEKSMVRIGEFSPHNPNLPVGRPVLGVGEYDERRRLLLDQRRQEYNQYLQQAQQVSNSASPSRSTFNHNQQLRNVATQTEWDDEVNVPVSLQNANSPPSRPTFDLEQLSLQQQHPNSCRLSPVPRCFEGLSEKEVKEHLYREELRRQIEEKNRLKDEVRRKEAEEEARIEAKIQRDLEKMKRQYEEERLQRLELAIRKKEQEDLHRQRLAAEQRRAALEAKVKKKSLMVNKSTSPREVTSRRPVGSRFCERQTVVPLSQSLPASKLCASEVLHNVHEELRKPLLEIQDRQVSSRVPSPNISASYNPVSSKPSASSPPLPVHRTKDVDILVHRTVFEPRLPSSPKENENNLQSPFPPSSVSKKIKEVDRLLKKPLLPESFQTLQPVSPPLIHATIPPVTAVSPPVPASRRIQRTDTEVFEDRWKVPYDQRYATSPDVFTLHNRSVLTQLGAFRKHLQEERQRMQQRVRDDSP